MQPGGRLCVLVHVVRPDDRIRPPWLNHLALVWWKRIPRAASISRGKNIDERRSLPTFGPLVYFRSPVSQPQVFPGYGITEFMGILDAPEAAGDQIDRSSCLTIKLIVWNEEAFGQSALHPQSLAEIRTVNYLFHEKRVNRALVRMERQITLHCFAPA